MTAYDLRTDERDRSWFVTSEHSRQALPKQKEEADYAEENRDQSHHMRDRRQKMNTMRSWSALAVTDVIFEAAVDRLHNQLTAHHLC